jgi:hypothetical protein
VEYVFVLISLTAAALDFSASVIDLINRHRTGRPRRIGRHRRTR